MEEEHSFYTFEIREGRLRRETRLARKKLPTSCLQHCAQKDTLSREMTLLKDKKDKSEQKMQAKQRCASAYQSSYSAKCLTFIVTRISCRSNRQVKQLPTPLVLRLGCERPRHTWTASIYARVFFSAVCFCEMGGQFCLPCTLSTSVLCKYLV